MSTISEQQFRELCESIYADRQQIYAFNPQMARRDALLWMLLGCLLSLLSVPESEQASYGAGTDPYRDAILELLRPRMNPVFDARAALEELARKIEVEGA